MTGKKPSAKAMKAARAGDLDTLRKEIEGGKTAVDGELLQLAASHPEAVRLLLDAGADPDERVHSYEEDVVADTFRQLAEMMADDGDESLLRILEGEGDGGPAVPGLFSATVTHLKPESRTDREWATDLIHAVGEQFGDFYRSWNAQATVKLSRGDGSGVLAVADMGRPDDDFGPVDRPTIAWKQTREGTSLVASKDFRDRRVVEALDLEWPDRDTFVDLDGVQGWGE
jgi:hypothetical protein